MIADTLQTAGRYRPYLVALVAVVLVVFVPVGRNTTSPSTGQDGGEGLAAVAPTVNGPATLDNGAQHGRAGDAAPAANITAAPSGSGAIRSAPATATPTGGPSAGGTTGSGVGSEAALSSPDCDRATGRVRAPWLFAPPCVRPWPAGADNGAATSIGVTRDTVRILVYGDPSQTAAVAGAFGTDAPDEEDTRRSWRKGAEALEHVHRMWGRRFELVFFNGAGNDEVAQRADAVKIASDIKPFAIIDHNATRYVLYQELATRGIISFPSGGSAKDTLAQPPYRWTITLGPDELLIGAVAEYAGKRLQGRPARWAGDAVMATKSRVFGLVHPLTWDRAEVKRELSRWGVQTAVEVDYDANDIPGQQERARLTISRLKDAGVTTVLAGADVLYTPVLTKEATSQQYAPEWIVTSFLGQDLDLFARVNDQTQWQHAFGVGASVGVGSTQPLPHDMLYHWYWGASDRDSSIGVLDLGPIANGIHLAGPHLTPESFRDGLFSMPPSGGTGCGCVLYPQRSYGRWGAFPWDDYTGFDDFAELWWDPSAQGPDNANLGPPGVGKYRYVDGGKRYTLGGWPSTEPVVFDRNRSVDYYTDPPPPDRPPGPYPCDGCPSSRG